MKCNLCHETDGELRPFDRGPIRTVSLSMKFVEPGDHYTETTIEARDFALCDGCRMSLWDGLTETLSAGGGPALKLADVFRGLSDV